MTWQTITAAEYQTLGAADGIKLGETLSDPGGRYGRPRMLTTWELDEQPYIRHQCWPDGTGGFSRPCRYDRWDGAA